MLHKCPHCGLLASFTKYTTETLWRQAAHSLSRCAECKGLAWTVTGVGPERIFLPLPRQASPALPDDVAELLQEALDDVGEERGRHTVLLCRRTLQAAAVRFGAEGLTLSAQLADLFEKQQFPDAVHAWAGEADLSVGLGDDPDPARPVTSQEVTSLLGLTETILDYLYVIPAQVSRRRAGGTESLGWPNPFDMLPPEPLGS